jgi:nucleoid-associated protein YgaU
MVAQERDALQARVNELASKFSVTTEALTSAEAQAKAATDSATASVASTAELETLRNRAAAAERAAETAKTELAHANQLLAAYRPTRPEPTRPIAPAGEPARTHTIAPGETLSSISQRYYGTTNRWSEILAANRDILVDERSFAAGRTLRIP